MEQEQCVIFVKKIIYKKIVSNLQERLSIKVSNYGSLIHIWSKWGVSFNKTYLEAGWGTFSQELLAPEYIFLGFKVNYIFYELP